MATLKTQRTGQSVEEFLETIADADRRKDCGSLLEIMKRATRAEPQKQNLTLYLMGGFPRRAELLQSLGKHKTGTSYSRGQSDERDGGPSPGASPDIVRGEGADREADYCSCGSNQRPSGQRGLTPMDAEKLVIGADLPGECESDREDENPPQGDFRRGRKHFKQPVFFMPVKVARIAIRP